MQDPARLLHAVAARDRAAFVELYHRYAGRIAGLVAERFPAARGREVAEEALLRIWRRSPQWAGVAAEAWIYGIVRDTAVELVRGAPRPVADPSDPLWVDAPAAILRRAGTGGAPTPPVA